MNTYEFWDTQELEENIEVEADTLEEACHIMFGDDLYQPTRWELLTVNGMY